MQRNSKFLSDVNMRKAWRVCDDGIGHKRSIACIARKILVRVESSTSGMRLWCRPKTIASFDTRAPAADQHLSDALTTLADLAILESIESWHQAGMLDHERHKLRGVSSYAEELEAVLLDEALKDGVGGDADAVAIGVPEDLAESDERLDITSRSNNLNDNIEFGWRRLSWFAAETGWDVAGWECRFSLKLSLDGWAQEVCQAIVLGVDIDGDATVVWNMLVLNNKISLLGISPYL